MHAIRALFEDYQPGLRIREFMADNVSKSPSRVEAVYLNICGCHSQNNPKLW